jgi:putative transposase
MPNYVHLILTPRTPEGLGRALGKAHRRYSAFVNPDAGDWPSFSGALFLGRDGRGPP